jgi:hypothetical protein
MAGWDDDEGWSDRDDQPWSEEVLDELVGSLYWISNYFWKFENQNQVMHPGLCVLCEPKKGHGTLVPGTSVKPGREDRYKRYGAVIVTPTAENRLTKAAAFSPEPRPMNLAMLVGLHRRPDRRIGRVPQEVVWSILHRLAELERDLGGSP